MKRIVYKDDEQQIIKELEMPIDQYYAEPADIEGKYEIREIYRNGELYEYTMFIDGNRDRGQVLQDLSLRGANVALGYRESLGEFRHEKRYYYNKDGILETIFNTVYDSENNVVVSSFTDDVENEVPYWNGTTKYYYDRSVRADDNLFECYYNDDGQLIPITIDVDELGYGDHDGTWVYNDAEGIADLVRIFGMSKQLAEFYVSSEIVPGKALSEQMS